LQYSGCENIGKNRKEKPIQFQGSPGQSINYIERAIGAQGMGGCDYTEAITEAAGVRSVGGTKKESKSISKKRRRISGNGKKGPLESIKKSPSAQAAKKQHDTSLVGKETEARSHRLNRRFKSK